MSTTSTDTLVIASYSGDEHEKLQIVCNSDAVAFKADEGVDPNDSSMVVYNGNITHVGNLMVKQPDKPVVNIVASVVAIEAGFQKLEADEIDDRVNRLGPDNVPEVQVLKAHLEAAKSSLAARRTEYASLRDTYNTQLDTDLTNMVNLQSSRVSKVQDFSNTFESVLERKEDVANKITSGLIEKRIKALGQESGVVEQEWKFLPIHVPSGGEDSENYNSDVSMLNRVKYANYTALQSSEFAKAIARQQRLEADAKKDSEAYLAHEKDKVKNELQLSLNALPNDDHYAEYNTQVTDVEASIEELQQAVNTISTTDAGATALEDLLRTWNAADTTVASRRAHVSEQLKTLRTSFERHRSEFESFRGET